MARVIKYIPTPQVIEFGVFAKAQDFIDRVTEVGAVEVIVKNETKTRIRVSLYTKGFNFSINMNNPTLKMVEKKTMNYFHGKEMTHYYFKILKKQMLPELEEHIRYCLNQVGIPEEVEALIHFNRTIVQITPESDED